MASSTEICNRALQKLGAARITELTQDTVSARACNVCYEILRDAELRAHPWNFSVKRAELAASATEPEWGRANEFPLPSDFLRLLPDYPEDNRNTKDWQIEGQSILSDDDDPIYIRYVYRVTDVSIMDPLFREALSCRIAIELCESLTQSNTKKDGLRADYERSIREARRANAFENVPAIPAEDSWITARS